MNVLDEPIAYVFNPLNAELNPIRHLLALERARHIVHASRIGVKVEETRKRVPLTFITNETLPYSRERKLTLSTVTAARTSDLTD